MGRTFFTPREYLTLLCCQISADSTLHFWLQLSFYLHIISFTLLLLSKTNFQTTPLCSKDFQTFQLKVNILDFLFSGIMKQFVALSLWGMYFFHVDPGYWVPPCVGISGSIAIAITDPETHAYRAFVNLLTDAFYLTHPVQIFLAAGSVVHVNDSINGCWSWALCTIEGEIPPSAANMTIVETKNSIEKDSQTSFGRFLVEKAFLWKLIRKEKITRKTGPALHSELIWCTPQQLSLSHEYQSVPSFSSSGFSLHLFANLRFSKCSNPYLYQASISVIIQFLVNTLFPVLH